MTCYRSLTSFFKKSAPMLVLLLFMAGCGPKYLTVSYLPPAPTGLTGRSVVVTVNDRRANQTIVSPALQDKGVFAGSASKMDIVVPGPDGQTSPLLEVNLKRAIEEAVKAKLRSGGFRTIDSWVAGASNIQTPYSLAIDIQQFYLDIAGRRITAQVAFTATSFRQGKEIFKEEISGQSQRIHLLGASEEEKALSQAISNALDSMSLQALAG